MDSNRQFLAGTKQRFWRLSEFDPQARLLKLLDRGFPGSARTSGNGFSFSISLTSSAVLIMKVEGLAIPRLII
jgi:hypothetical protein